MTKEIIKIKVIEYLKAQAKEFVTPDNLVIITDDDKLTFQFDGDLAEYINLNSYDCDYDYFNELDFDNREDFGEFLEKSNIEYDWYSSTVLYIYISNLEGKKMSLNEFINGNIRETTIRAYIDILNIKYKLWVSYNNIWLDEYNNIDRKRNQFERFLEMEVKSLPENFEARIYFGFENLSDSPLNAICNGNYRGDYYEFKLSEYHSYKEEEK